MSDGYLYSAFGEERQVSGNSANPLRFGGEVGYYRDEAKRLYVRARYLDVVSGYWLSPDPIGFNGGDFSLYRYVRNSPMNAFDPDGLFELPLLFKSSACQVSPSCSAALKEKRKACGNRETPTKTGSDGPVRCCYDYSWKLIVHDKQAPPKDKCMEAIKRRDAGVRCVRAREWVIFDCHGGVDNVHPWAIRDEIAYSVTRCQAEAERWCGKTKPPTHIPAPVIKPLPLPSPLDRLFPNAHPFHYSPGRGYPLPPTPTPIPDIDPTEYE